MSSESIDHELLASYADGPRIWDAADIWPHVLELAEAGLIEPVPDRGGAYRLTMAGDLELMRDSYARDPAPPQFVAQYDQVRAEVMDKINGLLSTFRQAASALGEDHATWSLIKHLLDGDIWEPDELALMLGIAIQLLAAAQQEQP